MGSQFPPAVGLDPGRTYRSKDEFIEACVEAVGRLDLLALFVRPPKVTQFLEAWLLARCLPIIMNRGKHTPPDWDSDDFGDELAKIAAIGERFLNGWTPTSAMEAALMLDLFNADDECFPDYLSQVPARIELWLFREGFAGNASALASSMLIEMNNQTLRAQ